MPASAQSVAGSRPSHYVASFQPVPARPPEDAVLQRFHAPVRDWFRKTFAAPERAPRLRVGRQILAGSSTLLLAPTGSGKTLAAFSERRSTGLMFAPGSPDKRSRCRLVYVSPLIALAVDVERNLRAPLAGIAAEAQAAGRSLSCCQRSRSAPATRRPPSARAMLRAPPDILITTPESLFLLLTSRARGRPAQRGTVIVDEIHSLVPTKRGAHLILSLERLEALCGLGRRPVETDATDRPLRDPASARRGGAISWRRRAARRRLDSARGYRSSTRAGRNRSS